ncbi:MAG TPA: [Fe-Fe] hydrogenase large subunit C-terminal domain-containing protein [Thermoleophilia bacterium]
MPSEENPLVTIIGEKCRMCYACVRECPAKAIQVVDGQASVIQPRCIGCGNCLLVCSQNAKHVRDDTQKAFALVDSGERTAAMLAPSFPAEFSDIEPGRLVAMIRALGFSSVHEMSLGADLIAHEYAKLLERDPKGRYITTPCPAVHSYVRKYQPALTRFLAPVLSPMVAMARVLRHDLGQDLHVVFIGPCIAKKRASIDLTHTEVDAVLTFAELREMFEQRRVKPDSVEAADDFDPPYGGVGAVFPISGGLLQTAGLQEDLLSGEIVVAEGRDEFVDAINEFDVAHPDARLLDVLSCQGCFAGAGMTSSETNLQRRSRISRYAKNRIAGFDEEQRAEVAGARERYADIDLSRSFRPDAQTLGGPATVEELREILERMGKHSEEDFLNCGACGYDTCLDHARAVYAGLADSEMCLPSTIEQLRTAYGQLEDSHRSLEDAKEALEKSGRLASMGQLAAGIAHEVNNPLGILLLHANLVLEECEEQSQIHEDLETIVDQANRCKRIISGLLNFARQSRVVRQPTDLAGLVKKVLHTTPVNEGVEVQVEDQLKDPVAEIDSDQIVQVLTNLLSNAQQAMPEGGTVAVGLSDTPEEVIIRVSDTGSGIPEENMAKLFDPFFTTKQVGMGTGLGLAVTHGIVKMHRGQITVESNSDRKAGPTGTTFTIKLPRYEERPA